MKVTVCQTFARESLKQCNYVMLCKAIVAAGEEVSMCCVFPVVNI